MAALGTLSAGIAHQFNNINAAVLGYLELLRMEPRLSADLREYVDAARSALDRAIEITGKLIILSTPSASQGQRRYIGDAVESALPSFDDSLASEGVHISLELMDSRPIDMDPRQMGFIVRSLLSNAIHALLDQPRREIYIRTGTHADRTFLQVRDTGIGIATDKQSSLFTPFFSQKGELAPLGSPQQRVKGVGLSLAVVNSIVKGLGGSVEAQSILGSGATFTVWLPNAQEAGSPGRRKST